MSKRGHGQILRQLSRQITAAQKIAQTLTPEAEPVLVKDPETGEDGVIYAYKDKGGVMWWLDTIGLSRIYDGTFEINGEFYHGKKFTNQ